MYSATLCCFILFSNIPHCPTLNVDESPADYANQGLVANSTHKMLYGHGVKIGSAPATVTDRMSVSGLTFINEQFNYSNNDANESLSTVDHYGTTVVDTEDGGGGTKPYLYRSEMKIIDATNWFLRKLQPNSFPDGLLSDYDLTDHRLFRTSISRNYRQWLNYDLGFVIVIAVCCISALIFTFCYLIYACCCCRKTSYCGSKDSRRQSYVKAAFWDGQIDSCRRFWLNLFLFVLVTIMMLLVACAIGSNILLHDATSKIPTDLRRSAGEISRYKAHTNEQLKKVLVDDFSVFKSRVNFMLDSASNEFASYAFGKSNSSVLNAIAKAIEDLETSETLFKNVRKHIMRVQTDLDALEVNLTNIDSWFENELAACQVGNVDKSEKDECTNAHDYSAKYLVPFDDLNLVRNFEEFDRYFADISETLKITDKRRQFHAGIEQLKSGLNENLVEEKRAINKKLDRIGIQLEGDRSSATNSIEKINLTHYEKYIDENEPTLMTYEYYRWLAAFGVCSIIGLVNLCLFAGLLFSVCGQRPGQYTSKCCLWSKSGCFFNCAVVLSLWFLCGLMAVTCLLFFAGGNGRVILCQDAQNSGEKTALYKLSERYWDIYKPRIDAFIHGPNEEKVPELLAQYNFSDVIEGCLQNKTLYSIFDLGKRSTLRSFEDIKDQIERESQIYMEKFRTADFKIDFLQKLSEDGDMYAKKFKEFDQNVKLSPEHLYELEANASSLNFNDSLQLLQSFADQSHHVTLKRTLHSLLDRLNSLSDFLTSIRENCVDLVRKMKLLAGQTLPTTLNALTVVTSGGKTLTTGSEPLADYATTFTDRLAGGLNRSMQDYMGHVTNQLETRISSCAPVQKIIARFTDSVCYQALDHFNIFWTCVGMVLLLLMPALIIATSLKNMYADSLKCDTDSGRSNNSRRCIVDAYSTVTDDYGCYRRGSDSSYNNPVGRNLNVHSLKFPTASSPCYTEMDSRRMPPPYTRR